MNSLICEICGNNELIKSGDYLKCEHCGTKYLIEDIKKKINSLEIKGTVKIDSSDELTNLYQLARRAKEEQNAENAQKYYDMILIKDPENWEPIFYSIYYKTMQCRIAEIDISIMNFGSSLNTVFNIISNNTLVEICKITVEVSIFSLSIIEILSDSSRSFYQGLDTQIKENYFQEYISRMLGCIDLFEKISNQIDPIVDILQDKINKDEEECKELLNVYLELLVENSQKARINSINIYSQIMAYLVEKAYHKEIFDKIVEKIREHEPNYNPPYEQKQDGCYIASFIYGSYDCSEVWVLRRFRDHFLYKRVYGRIFIKTYYFCSPIFLKYCSNITFFKATIKNILDLIVHKLQRKGYKNTPYNDNARKTFL